MTSTSTNLSHRNAVVAALEHDGIALVPGLVRPDALLAMQAAYRRVLGHLSWNTTRGYHQSDLHRRMVDDILTLDPAFQELGLHSQVQEILRDYLGPSYVLTEVKGWETVIAKRDFHGWHNDAWYDHRLPEVPREVKLGLYLTDVETGFFSYIKGTHVNNRHRHWNDRQIADLQRPHREHEGRGRNHFSIRYGRDPPPVGSGALPALGRVLQLPRPRDPAAGDRCRGLPLPSPHPECGVPRRISRRKSGASSGSEIGTTTSRGTRWRCAIHSYRAPPRAPIAAGSPPRASCMRLAPRGRTSAGSSAAAEWAARRPPRSPLFHLAQLLQARDPLPARAPGATGP